ncbi:hypothetical protein [Haliscomenobacter hydrossis]|uniref:Uncharacterized protein n=1 Tax=Haliscomenobacter hydrossis (strain ATCC 27775 / DSM 1100 / LMG 10767 / O) TaxID=760192 RepID=F4KWD5_HALH1|nr:hypothetical protein [Haliscomenobacter hydrossis]AEE50285.1 hypothetical protein Halhy_2410 [Haliscomenobacter hydrossis DSM 1100]
MSKTILLLLSFVPLYVYGQKRTPVLINLSFFNEATAIPFTQAFSTPIHPGLQIGTEFNLKSKPSARLFQTANLNYFYHHRLNHGISLYSELGYEQRLQFGPAFSALFGLGYLHTFATAEEFIFQDGQYLNKNDRGNARLLASLAFDVGFYVKKDQSNSPKIFLRYQSWLEYPYSPGFIPLMTHTNLHLGTKIFLTKKNLK